jgi:Stress responsive A/B Barrel Domain
MKSFRGVRLIGLLAGMLLFSSLGAAQDKKLMHCFFFTPVAEATPAQWDAFYKATYALPGKIPGVSKVWAGKLRSTSADREYGVCMEMANEATLKTYAAHPAHADWVKVYAKVRVEGTSTFDIIEH